MLKVRILGSNVQNAIVEKVPIVARIFYGGGMDPLSDVLSLLKLRSSMSGGIDAGGDWCLQFEEHNCFRCVAIVSGHCWLAMDGVSDAVWLGAGDCLVLPHGRPFRLASDLTVPPVALKTVIDQPLNGRIRSWNGGGGCLGISALFTFASSHADILIGVLPPIVHIRNDSGRAAMRCLVERMMLELRQPQPGSFLLGQHLAQMMLVEVLRLYMAESAGSHGKAGAGWLIALADRQIGASITAMHEHPARRWTLAELAGRSGMSRSIFAVRFKEAVGETPIEYLTRWRMMLAADRLKRSNDGIAAIASSLGYESESAFGKAFKRVMGRSPRQYSRSHDLESSGWIEDGDGAGRAEYSAAD